MTEIDPAAVHLQVAGNVYREWVIRLPAEFTTDDFTAPSLFAKLQASPKCLVRHDRVYLVAHDESWVMDAIVNEANGHAVKLAGFRTVLFG